MKSIGNVLFCALCFTLLFNCNIKASGYYLHDEKIYLHDFSDNSITRLKLTDKPIYNFWLSPEQDYIAIEVEEYRSDCDWFTSLAVYELKEKKLMAELKTGKYSSIQYFQGWKSDKEFAYIESISPGRGDHGKDEMTFYSCTYTIGGKNTRKKANYFTEGDSWYDGEMIKKDPVSLNDSFVTQSGEENIILTNKKTGEEKLITVSDEDVKYYQVNAWLNSDRFLFTVVHHSTAQCDNEKCDLYLYHLSTGQLELIMIDAAYLQMIK